MNALDITKELIACHSVTPHVGAAFDVVERHLKPLGFEVRRVVFDEGGHTTENLYARLGASSPNLCFAGHLDVVPPGDWTQWRFPPFEPTEHKGFLYGRGAEDMKGAVGAFIAAASDYVQSGSQAGSLSLLLTGDEEGIAINGTPKMLEWLAQRTEKIDACLVGEPTNPEVLGEMIKVGRRGSLNAELTVHGKQGHVAYPHLADNPVTKLIDVLHALTHEPLDEGTEFFPPSNLEVTSIDVGNETCNVIPPQASARINIRFNDRHTGDSLSEWLAQMCDQHIGAGKYELQCRCSGEAFLTQDDKLTNALVGAVQSVTGLTPALSTTGGTSDARFIKNICPVIEFGTTGSTAHHVDEKVAIDTLDKLQQIYLAFIKAYFKANVI